MDRPLVERVHELAACATRDRVAFEPPPALPAEERALSYLREGFGPMLLCYLEGRTGGRLEPFTPRDVRAIEYGLETWLGLYARCYGHDVDPAVSVREAATLFVQTHDVRDVAVLLTRIPAAPSVTKIN